MEWGLLLLSDNRIDACDHPTIVCSLDDTITYLQLVITQVDCDKTTFMYDQENFRFLLLKVAPKNVFENFSVRDEVKLSKVTIPFAVNFADHMIQILGHLEKI